jgi:hypothetical protein
MIAVRPPTHEHGVIIEFAKGQENTYKILPASVDPTGSVMTEWEFTAEEFQTVLEGGRVRLWLLYTIRPCDKCQHPRLLSPMALEVIK